MLILQLTEQQKHRSHPNGLSGLGRIERCRGKNCSCALLCCAQNETLGARRVRFVDGSL